MLRKSLPPLLAARRPKTSDTVVPASRTAAKKDVTGNGRLGLRASLRIVGRTTQPRAVQAGRRIGASSC